MSQDSRSSSSLWMQCIARIEYVVVQLLHEDVINFMYGILFGHNSSEVLYILYVALVF